MTMFRPDMTLAELAQFRVTNMDGTPIARPTPAQRRRGRLNAQDRLAAQGVGLVPCVGCKGNVQLKVPILGPQPVLPPPVVPAPAPPGKLQGKELLSSLAQAHPCQPIPFKWACAVTTVPERRANGLLLRTLASLRTAGFPDPQVFEDGGQPRMRTVGRWITAAWELLIRNPQAERFGMFQDDFVLCKNARELIDATPWPDKGYLNLFTFQQNEHAIKDRPPGWHRGHRLNPGTEDQMGLGAVALCFTREGLGTLLSSEHLVRKVLDIGLDTKGMPGGQAKPWPDGSPRLMGQVRIDGAIVTAMNLAGWREYVHQPSLAQHVGLDSSMNNHGQALAQTFREEKWDALSLLPAPSAAK